MRLPPRQTAEPTLNLSPLIDVIFILLIFVILVARFVDQERLDVTLPSAAAGRPAEVDALQLTISQEGEIFVEGKRVERDDLSDRLEVERQSFTRAVVMADQDGAVQDAVFVLSAAKLAGFQGVALATRPPDP